MAADTRNKRASAIGVALPAPRLEQNPQGIIQKLGRHMAAYLYVGITVNVIVPTFTNFNSTTRQLSSAEAIALLS